MVPCDGAGRQGTVHFSVFWGHENGPTFDDETLFVTVRQPGAAEIKRAVVHNETDLAITILGSGQLEVEAALSAGHTPGLQSEAKVFANRADCH